MQHMQNKPMVTNADQTPKTKPPMLTNAAQTPKTKPPMLTNAAQTPFTKPPKKPQNKKTIQKRQKPLNRL